MKRLTSIFLGGTLALASFVSYANPFYCSYSDDDLAYYVILESRQSYIGFCVCPEDLDGYVNYCGERSAYLKPTSFVAHCYPEDITQAMIDDYRSEHCPEKKC